MEEKHAKYFEGILQLRNPTDESIAFVRNQIKKKKGVFISKEVAEKNGVDFYVSSQRFIQQLGRKMHEHFGGRLKVSPQLFSRNHQTSKEVYRVNVLVEIPSYNIGDVIKFDGNLVKITSLGKKISGLNLKTGKKKTYDYPAELEILKVHKTTTSKLWPEHEVLHPETFQSVKPNNKKQVEIDEKVKVVIDNGIWVV